MNCSLTFVDAVPNCVQGRPRHVHLLQPAWKIAEISYIVGIGTNRFANCLKFDEFFESLDEELERATRLSKIHATKPVQQGEVD